MNNDKETFDLFDLNNLDRTYTYNLVKSDLAKRGYHSDELVRAVHDRLKLSITNEYVELTNNDKLNFVQNWLNNHSNKFERYALVDKLSDDASEFEVFSTEKMHTKQREILNKRNLDVIRKDLSQKTNDGNVYSRNNLEKPIVKSKYNSLSPFSFFFNVTNKKSYNLNKINYDSNVVMNQYIKRPMNANDKELNFKSATEKRFGELNVEIYKCEQKKKGYINEFKKHCSLDAKILNKSQMKTYKVLDKEMVKNKDKYDSRSINLHYIAHDYRKVNEQLNVLKKEQKEINIPKHKVYL